MKKNFLLLIASMLLGLTASSQAWLKLVPPNADGRPDYRETKKYLESFRNENPETPLKGEKQFLRSKFFLDGRIMEDGHLPAGIYWEEGKMVLVETNP